MLIALLVSVGWLGLRQMARINSNLEEIASKRWAKVQLAGDALFYSNLNNRLTMEIFFLRDREDIDPLLTRRADNTQMISALVRRIEEQVESAEEKSLLDNINRARTPYIDSYLRGIDLLLKKQNYEEAQRNMVQDTLPRLIEYHNAWNAFVQFQGDQMDDAVRMSRASYLSTRRLALGLLISAILVAASIALFVTRSLTAEITQRLRAELELAGKAEELARSNAELEQFAYVASHDLQEPLRMVASYTQLLARRYGGKLGTEADEFIGFAVDGAKRMQQLIQDLLSYSRVTTKGKALDLMPAEAACNLALGNLQETIKDSNAKVCVGPLPEVLADASQLTQLFQNLIGNAVKYRNERKPEIQVAAKSNRDHWVFSVQDNGIGIEPQYFERIFQMFQRLHTRKDYSGTGIGLAVCRKIVERHGGRIWVESQPGQGSTFLFTIPHAERIKK